MADPGHSFYIIAGEPSGDNLGADLMVALQAEGPAEFHGVGGMQMQGAGLQSLFEMSELTVMGLSEVLPKLPNLVRRIRHTAEDVITRRPNALITIDSPDFTLRVAAKVKKALPDLKVIHYVAPSVWAWRPGRAAKMARHVDHVLALLPFEPPFMHAAGMSCDFVGHPIAAWPEPSAEDLAAYRTALSIGADQKALLVALGSRRGEVRRLTPVFKEAIALLRQKIPDLALIVPVAETVQAEVRAAFRDVQGDVHLLPDLRSQSDKLLAFGSADAALCASGTITLELASAGTPMVAAYRTTWMTAQIVRRVIKINTANLINLISGRLVVPEFLQEFATPASLRSALDPLLAGGEAAAQQQAAFQDVMSAMGRGGPRPEMRAASSVLSVLAGDRPRPRPGPVPTDIRPGPTERHGGRRGI
ncbi:MAG: lipid-A-disaccharide synthase [Pseudomonadota bacterium]